MKKILVVDDNWVNRQVMIDLLKLIDPTCQIAIASDGKEGIKKVLRDKPDLVIADLAMPEKGGEEMIRELRSHPDIGEELPIIVSSARRFDFDWQGMGANGVLGKPIDKNILASILDRV